MENKPFIPVILERRKLRPGKVRDFPEATQPGPLMPVSLTLFLGYQVPHFISEKTAAQRGTVTHLRPHRQSIIYLPCP